MNENEEFEFRLRAEQEAKAAGTPKPQEKMSFGDSMLHGAGVAARAGLEGFVSPVTLAASIPSALINAGNAIGNKLLDNNVPMLPTATGMFSKGLDELGLPKPSNAAERLGSAVVGGATGSAGIARAAAQIAPQMINPVASGVAGQMAANPGAQIVGGAAGGGAGQTAAELGFGPTGQFAASMAGALAPSVGGNLAARAIKPTDFTNAEQRALNARAEQLGFNLSIGQQTNNKNWKTAESTLKESPGGGSYQAIDQANRETLSRQALQTIGSTGNAVTPDVLADAALRIGNNFNRLVGNQTTIPLGQPFRQELASIAQDYRTALGKNDVIDPILQDAMTYVQAGNMTGREYQIIRGSLRRDAVDQIRAGKSNIGNTLNEIADAFDNAAQATMPPRDLQALQQSRREYRNLMTLEDATTRSQAGKTGIGELDPTALANAVVTNRGKRGFSTMGLGNGDELADLSRVAIGIKDLVPNSGTAQRNYWLRILGSLAAGATPGGAGGNLAAATGGAVASVGIPMAASQMLTNDGVKGWLATPPRRYPIVPVDALIQQLKPGQ